IGEPGWELHVEPENAARVFLTLETAGTMHHIGYYGAFAANAMRLEKGYAAWGADLTTERSPLEAGLGAFVREGVGLMRKDAWRLVLLEIVPGEVDPFYAHTVWQDGRAVGIVTSGAHGHRTGKTLAFAYMRDASARDGLTVSLLGEHRAAFVLDEVPYDPGNLRLRE
ncbi:MAG: glycine cleavage T C-terminal barrel domain-containing protein, partial [Pseudomonadota bacterium]